MLDISGNTYQYAWFVKKVPEEEDLVLKKKKKEILF
jgi:hypothetical protein